MIIIYIYIYGADIYHGDGPVVYHLDPMVQGVYRPAHPTDQACVPRSVIPRAPHSLILQNDWLAQAPHAERPKWLGDPHAEQNDWVAKMAEHCSKEK
jgi:hypothetical protein